MTLWLYKIGIGVDTGLEVDDESWYVEVESDRDLSGEGFIRKDSIDPRILERMDITTREN